MEMTRDLLDWLRSDGVIRCDSATLTALEGGVSSEIYRLTDGERIFAVKRALEKLKVADDWRADVSRNRYEVEFLRRVGKFLPDAVPRVVYADDARGYFVMEFLSEEFQNWKSLLLDEVCRREHAARAGEILGTIQNETWGKEKYARAFDSTENFRQLRTGPYLRTSASRNPPLEERLLAEAKRIETTRRCLVHGDFSPKNILISPDRMVLVDCEVAWFGDPAFDPAFLLNHFLLKALLLPKSRFPLLGLARAAWESYGRQLGTERLQEVESSAARLLPMLMLARVDGKSPVEYFSENPAAQKRIRIFATTLIGHPVRSVAEVIQCWREELSAAPSRS